MNTKRYLLALLALCLVPGIAYGAEGRIPISAAGPITAPGSYIVTGDITATGSQHGIEILANDVSIDLDGHTLVAPNPGFWGIFANDRTNIRVTNGSVRGYNGGVYLRANNGSFHIEGLNIAVLSSSGSGIHIRGAAGASAYAVVKNNIVTGSSPSVSGIEFNQAKGLIEGNKISKWTYAIFLESCSNVFVEKNIAASNNSYGIYLYADSNYNVLRNNSVSENGIYGIVLQDSHYNTIESNAVSGNTSSGIYLHGGAGFSADYNGIRGNTTACATGSGLYIGGCGNISTDNKAPGNCTITVVTCGVDPNIDGGGNTP